MNAEPAVRELDYAALHAEVLKAIRGDLPPAPKPGSVHPDEVKRWIERRDLAINELEARCESLRDQLVAVEPGAWHEAAQQAFTEGVYTVSVKDCFDWDSLSLVVGLCAHAGVSFPVAEELMKRIEHVGPETVAEGVSLDDAIRIKEDLRGFDVRIKEGIRPRKGEREPIPERVRREVWRRDGGKCVDCSSRERLEFDHIIPVSQGGSNTARNIELRCESCNRRKGATI